VARPDRDAVSCERSHPFEDGRGVIVRAGRGTGVDQEQVAPRRFAPHDDGERLGVVGHDLPALHVGSCLPHLSRQHQRVGVGKLAGPRLDPGGDQLVARRDDDHPRPAADWHRRDAGGGDRPQVRGAQPVSLWQQQLGRRDVLADRADVLVRRHRGEDLHGVAVALQVLQHHDRVEARRKRIAGVDRNGVVAQPQPSWRRFRGADSPGGADGDAVHRGGVEGWGRAAGPDRLRRHSTERIVERHRLHGERRAPPGRLEDIVPSTKGVLERHVVQVMAPARATEGVAARHR
jgi:hypothetical protein